MKCTIAKENVTSVEIRPLVGLELEESLAASILNLIPPHLREFGRRLLFQYQESVDGAWGETLAEIEDRLIAQIPKHAAEIQQAITPDLSMAEVA